MPFNPMFGWIPEASDAKLIPSTKKENNVPVSKGWAAARQEQLNARTEGRQAAPNVPTPIAPVAGQMHGPAYGQGSPNDVWSPQGFGVTGLKDVFGMNLPTPGIPRPSQPTGTPAMGGSVSTENANGVTQSMRPMSSASAAIDMNRSFEDLPISPNLRRCLVGKSGSKGHQSAQLGEDWPKHWQIRTESTHI